jgi:type I restriction enzyme S subunit
VQYPQYENTGVVWNPLIPSNWLIKRGKHIFYNDKELNTGNKSSNILSLTLKGVINNDADNPIGLSPRDYATYQLFIKDDLVFKLIDLENYKTSRVGIVHEDGIMSSAYIRLTRRNHADNVRYLYLYYYDLYLRGVFNNLGAGVRSTLGVKELLEVPVFMPPRDEQDQIVRFLDWKVSQVNKLISAKRRQIGLLQGQKQAMVNEAVTGDSDGWRKLRIKATAKILRGKFSHRPRNDPDFYDGEYPFIQTGDVARAGKYIRKYKQTLNQKGFGVSKQFPKGTLTMAIAANIGDVAILDFDACFPDSIIGFVPYTGMDLEYLYYAFYSMKSEFVKEAPVNTQGNLNVERVGAMLVNVPSYEVQRKIVAVIENKTSQIDGLASTIRLEIDLFTEYRTRLISDVVTGKLDVRGVTVPEYEMIEETADGTTDTEDDTTDTEVDE